MIRARRRFLLAGAVFFATTHCGSSGSSTASGGDRPDSGAGGTDGGSVLGNGDAAALDGATGDDGPTSTTPPAIVPTLVVSTYIGGAGDQFISGLAFDAHGNLTATMLSTADSAGAAVDTTVTYDSAFVHGDVAGPTDASMDITEFHTIYPLPQGGLSTNEYSDARNGQTYSWGTHPNVASGNTVCPTQCAGECTVGQPQADDLQMAFVTSSAGWKLWDFGWTDCVQACEVADSRGYDLWPVPGGKVGVMLWTDGGDTPLLQDPTDVTKKETFTQSSFDENPGGMGILLALVDPTAGTVSAGTFLPTHAVYHTSDAWGREYIAKALPIRYGMSPLPQPTNPFDMSTNADTGLFVLGSDFSQPEIHFYLGGDPSTCPSGSAGIQEFDAIALSGNMLALAGTTCATGVPTTANAVQAAPGGGQDGFLVVLKLWD
jgi:hypothetical protein